MFKAKFWQQADKVDILFPLNLQLSITCKCAPVLVVLEAISLKLRNTVSVNYCVRDLMITRKWFKAMFLNQGLSNLCSQMICERLWNCSMCHLECLPLFLVHSFLEFLFKTSCTLLQTMMPKYLFVYGTSCYMHHLVLCLWLKAAC